MRMKTPISPKGIFFDVDDTLYDHLAPFRDAVQKVARPDGMFPYEAAYHRMRYYSDKLSVELGGAGTAAYGEAVEDMRRRRFQLALAEFGVGLTLEEAERYSKPTWTGSITSRCLKAPGSFLRN